MILQAAVNVGARLGEWLIWRFHVAVHPIDPAPFRPGCTFRLHIALPHNLYVHYTFWCERA